MYSITKYDWDKFLQGLQIELNKIKNELASIKRSIPSNHRILQELRIIKDILSKKE